MPNLPRELSRIARGKFLEVTEAAFQINTNLTRVGVAQNCHTLDHGRLTVMVI